MTEHIPRHRADIDPAEPQIGSIVNEFLQGLDFAQVRQRYLDVYYQCRQDNREGGDTDVLQMEAVRAAYPGLHALIIEMARTEDGKEFSNGLVIGAVAVLSVIKSTIEVDELERLFRA